MGQHRLQALLLLELRSLPWGALALPTRESADINVSFMTKCCQFSLQIII
jgi:hypothetical protein